VHRVAEFGGSATYQDRGRAALRLPGIMIARRAKPVGRVVMSAKDGSGVAGSRSYPFDAPA